MRPSQPTPPSWSTAFSVVRGGVPVLDGLSLEVQAGAVTGPRRPERRRQVDADACARRRAARRGRADRGAREPAGSPSLRRRVGYLTQAPSVYARSLGAREPRLLRAPPPGRAHGAIDELIAAVALQGFERRVVVAALRRAAGACLARDGAARRARAARARRAHGRARSAASTRPLGPLPPARGRRRDADRLEPRDGRGRTVRLAPAPPRRRADRARDARTSCGRGPASTAWMRSSCAWSKAQAMSVGADDRDVAACPGAAAARPADDRADRRRPVRARDAAPAALPGRPRCSSTWARRSSGCSRSSRCSSSRR